VAIKTNVLYPTLVKGASLAVETATSRRTSLNLYGAFGSNGQLALAQEYKFQNLLVEERFYSAKSKGVFQGFYVAPYTKYMHRQIYRKAELFVPGRDSDGHSVGLGTAIGLQVQPRWAKRLLVDAFMGGGYLIYISQVDYANPTKNRFGHLDLRAGLSVGCRLD
jgi:hypothetical protein